MIPGGFDNFKLFLLKTMVWCIHVYAIAACQWIVLRGVRALFKVLLFTHKEKLNRTCAIFCYYLFFHTMVRGFELNWLLRATVHSGALIVTLGFFRVEANTGILTIIAPLHSGWFFCFLVWGVFNVEGSKGSGSSVVCSTKWLKFNFIKYSRIIKFNWYNVWLLSPHYFQQLVMRVLTANCVVALFIRSRVGFKKKYKT